MLKVDFLTQRNAVKLNFHGSPTINQPSNHCFPTSATMKVNFVGEKIGEKTAADMSRAQYENILMTVCMDRLPKGQKIETWYESTGRYLWENHEEAVNRIFSKTSFRVKAEQMRSFHDLEKNIDKGFPTVCGANIFKGHVILYLGDGHFNDPYGNFMDGYRDPVGKAVDYSTVMNKIFSGGNHYLRVV